MIQAPGQQGSVGHWRFQHTNSRIGGSMPNTRRFLSEKTSHQIPPDTWLSPMRTAASPGDSESEPLFTRAF
jgi:hypothetical protein